MKTCISIVAFVCLACFSHAGVNKERVKVTVGPIPAFPTAAEVATKMEEREARIAAAKVANEAANAAMEVEATITSHQQEDKNKIQDYITLAMNDGEYSTETMIYRASKKEVSRYFEYLGFTVTYPNPEKASTNYYEWIMDEVVISWRKK